MALIKKSDDKTHLTIDYRIPNVTSRGSALRWMAECSQNKSIQVKRIDVDDFRSYHDGSVSTQFEHIKDIDKFVDNYKTSQIVSVSVLGDYRNSPFVLSVSLDTGIIGLSCRKSNLVDYDSLATLLGLI